MIYTILIYKAPTKKDLIRHMENTGNLNFPSLVEEAYNTKKMDDKESHLAYRNLLELSGDQMEKFKGITNRHLMPCRFDPADWD